MITTHFLRFFFFVVLIFTICETLAQRGGGDSLWHIYSDNSMPDSIRVKAIHKIASNYNSRNFDSCLLLKEKEIQFALKCKLYRHAIEDLNKIGAVFCNKGDYSTAMKYSFRALKVSEEIADKREMAECFNCIGVIYDEQSFDEKAFEYYFKALTIKETLNDAGPRNKLIIDIYEKQSNYEKALEFALIDLVSVQKMGDKSLLAWYYYRIGGLYKKQHDYAEALNYYQKSINLSKVNNEPERIAACYSEISDVNFQKYDFSAALEYAYKALNIWEARALDLPISGCNTAIAEIYKYQHDYSKALAYYLKALIFMKKSRSYEYGVGRCYIEIGVVYDSMSNFRLSKTYFDSSFMVSERIGNIELKSQSFEKLAGIYWKAGNYKSAYAFYVKYKILSDSLFNLLNGKKINDYKTKIEVQKREDELKAIALSEEIKASEARIRQQIVIYAIAALLFVVIMFSIFLNRRFQITKSQKIIIQQQKHLVEEKQTEILDSITYAKRLQEAILPPREFVNKNIPENFIFYQPKDIVAGDFYWAEKIGNDFYIAAADSTGHGVPGAMVSVVCSNALNRSIKEFKETDTGRILDKTRELVIETFEKSDAEVKDGMDISLLRLSHISDGEVLHIQWSGAYNPLWFYVNGELNEIKADKRPIGKHDDPVPFTSNSITITTPTTFYLFSDGYADQFSPSDKKLMTRKFKKILSSIQNLSMAEQGKHLEKFHKEWKGNMEQTDDVLVIGIRIAWQTL